MKNVQNIRSLKPTDVFEIVIKDSEDFLIVVGGKDIIIKLKEPAFFTSVEVSNMNKLNGAFTDLLFIIQFEHTILAGDMLHLELPENVDFVGEVRCYDY